MQSRFSRENATSFFVFCFCCLFGVRAVCVCVGTQCGRVCVVRWIPTGRVDRYFSCRIEDANAERKAGYRRASTSGGTERGKKRSDIRRVTKRAYTYVRCARAWTFRWRQNIHHLVSKRRVKIFMRARRRRNIRRRRRRRRSTVDGRRMAGRLDGWKSVPDGRVQQWDDAWMMGRDRRRSRSLTLSASEA